ncbi:MAG TPA: sugar-transfer associated ATP-grasp domain-containing protein, partial [Nitrospiraceae bacterium]|nr:sugar-transfer associated ATP-grasp domain-containing protein [Nitrospiraceae bacterium]
MVGFSIFCFYLQITLQSQLAQLFLVRIFFQITLAAFVIASLKNVLGIRTLGTFAPAIVALAFLATGLALGLALLAVILAAVFLTRMVLIRETVQTDHRVAILVTLVAVTMSSIALLGLQIGQHILFFTVLFPVLITAWIGERYVERATRVGWSGPTIELAGTIGLVIVSFFVITQDILVDFIMINPVTWVLLILANWLLGTRLRLRVSEKYRFWGPTHHGGGPGDGPDGGDWGGDLLTMTVRNREFVAKYNPPHLLEQLGKDKVKRALIGHGVPMVPNYLVAADRASANTFKTWLINHDKFALKPASGYGGEGILLVKGARPDGNYETNTGLMTPNMIKAHALSIVEGEFHDRQSDVAIVEELVQQDESLKDISPLGLADFRIICLLGFPAMAMMRIPTKKSGGKANLHLGAVGAAVQISTGTIIHSMLHGNPQPHHPDTGRPIIGRKIPFWDDILEVAAEAQRLTGLGFAGVDVVLDAKHGPIVMEVNRRPGLEIQNANATGLLRRLRVIEKLPRQERPVEDRIRIAKQLDLTDWRSP